MSTLGYTLRYPPNVRKLILAVGTPSYEFIQTSKIRHHQALERIAPTHRFCYEAANEGFRNHFWKFDYTHQLCNIHYPTLILVSEEDWICDPKYSKTMASLIPNSRL